MHNSGSDPLLSFDKESKGNTDSLQYLGKYLSGRSPQIPWITETSMPNLDPFSPPLLLAVTFQQITINCKHESMPIFLERACVVFSSFLEEKLRGAICRKY